MVCTDFVFQMCFLDEGKLATDQLSKFIYGKMAELFDTKLHTNFMLDKDFETTDDYVYQLMF